MAFLRAGTSASAAIFSLGLRHSEEVAAASGSFTCSAAARNHGFDSKRGADLKRVQGLAIGPAEIDILLADGVVGCASLTSAAAGQPPMGAKHVV
jgi:hypothetical protein